jgi:hypothetical protein
MRSNSARIALAVGAIAALVVLFVVVNGGSDNNSNTNTGAKPGSGSTGAAAAAAPKPAVINVVGGKPAGGIKKLSYTKGQQVMFQVNSDIADEIHVHGYDFHKDVQAGKSVSFSFPATIEGVFVIELEAKGEQIAQLTVNPS